MAFYGRYEVEVEPDNDNESGSENEPIEGNALVGREISLLWEDGKRYTAVVVRYYQKDDEYKLVYPEDEGVEIADIKDRQWYLLDKRISTDEKPVLTGATIKFVYPKDKLSYTAMIYHHSPSGHQLKVCYIDEHSTDAISGKGWTFITNSPCAHHIDEEDVSTSTTTTTNTTNSSGVSSRKDVGATNPQRDAKYGLDVRRGRVAKSKKPWVK